MFVYKTAQIRPISLDCVKHTRDFKAILFKMT